MTKQSNAGVKEEYLIPRLKLLDLDSLIVPTFRTLLVYLGAMVRFFPPLIQFS